MKHMLLLTFILVYGLAHAAQDGNDQTNGGDICESRIIFIRDDISQWLNKGGGFYFRFPGGFTINQYREGLLSQMDAEISCVDETLKVNGAEKTCTNDGNRNGKPKIKCNTKRFSETSNEDQYVLIHHEYAGLAGIEENDGAESKYYISRQIGDHLKANGLKKLEHDTEDRSKLKLNVQVVRAIKGLPGWKGDKLSFSGKTKAGIPCWINFETDDFSDKDDGVYLLAARKPSGVGNDNGWATDMEITGSGYTRFGLESFVTSMPMNVWHRLSFTLDGRDRGWHRRTHVFHRTLIIDRDRKGEIKGFIATDPIGEPPLECFRREM